MKAARLIAPWLLAWTGLSQAGDRPYPKPPFTPPPGHPRVYFTTRHVPVILANARKPQNARAWAAHQANLERGTDGALPAVPEGISNHDSNVLAIIESQAFEYALQGDRSRGMQAIQAIRRYVETVRYPARDYNNTGQTVFTIAVVYDWCHALLTPDDRRFLHEAALRTAALTEIGWPPVKQGNVTGHGPEAQLQRDLLSAAVAMYDEHPDMYERVAGRFFAEFIEPKRFMYPAHMHHQGSHYMSYRFQWEMLATWIFDRIGRPLIFGPDQQYLMYWALYARRPDGQLLRDGDTHMNNRPLYSYYTGPQRSMFLAANYFGDSYLKMEAARELPLMTPTAPRGNQSMNPVEMLVFNDPKLQPRPFDELPTAKYFPSPKGAMIARTGWRDGLNSPDMVVEMKINEWYFTNHQHLDAGAFQIYYKGALAIDSGYYQAAINRTDTPENDGSSGYGSLYDVNYNKRSVAHNTIAVFDPNERFATQRWARYPMANDGGQRFPNLGIEMATHAEFLDPTKGYRIGTVLGHEIGPDAHRPSYTYLKGDLSRAYSAKVRGYERSFVFLDLKDGQHPGALIVFDRVESSDKAFPKAWRLHGLQQPEVNGTQTVYRDTRPGYNGKLTVNTLLPRADDVDIRTIGGPGRENWVDGKSYRVVLRPEGLNEGGGEWRVEVSPREARETDHFLHVIQATDARPEVPALPVAPLRTTTHEGVQLADRVVLLGRERDRIASELRFEFTGPGDYEIVVADLQAGQWRVVNDRGMPRTVAVREEGGVASWRDKSGAYVLSYVGPATEPPGSAAVRPHQRALDITGMRIGGQLVYLPVMPLLLDGTVMLPLRDVAEKLGWSTSLDSDAGSLTLQRGSRRLHVQHGANHAEVDGRMVTFGKSAQLRDGVLMVPLDVLSAGLGVLSEYDPFARIVNISRGTTP